MKNDIAEKWVAALRSGEYKQTRSRLKDSNGFCCLGVLSDLATKEDIGKWQDDVFVSNKGNMATQLLPNEVMEWAELKTVSGYFVPHYHGAMAGGHLCTLNDQGGTFPEIANIIEQNAKVL